MVRFWDSNILAIGLSALSLGALWFGPAQRGQAHYRVKDHPAAVLAWAATHCYRGIALAPAAARAYDEDLRQVGAILDAEAAARRLNDVCVQALTTAARVIDARTHPASTGERSLHADILAAQ